MKAKKSVLGWWFGGEVLAHGDGRPVVVGETHEVEGEPKLFNRGLHALSGFDERLYEMRHELQAQHNRRLTSMVCAARRKETA